MFHSVEARSQVRTGRNECVCNWVELCGTIDRARAAHFQVEVNSLGGEGWKPDVCVSGVVKSCDCFKQKHCVPKTSISSADRRFQLFLRRTCSIAAIRHNVSFPSAQVSSLDLSGLTPTQGAIRGNHASGVRFQCSFVPSSGQAYTLIRGPDRILQSQIKENVSCKPRQLEAAATTWRKEHRVTRVFPG